MAATAFSFPTHLCVPPSSRVIDGTSRADFGIQVLALPPVLGV